jgi:DNA processing protein
MNPEPLYWVWLQCALGISSSLRTGEILGAFDGEAKAVFAASDYERRVAGVFTYTQLDRLRKTSLAEAEKILEECAQANTHILTPRTAQSPREAVYPRLLAMIPNFPLALYVRGSLACLGERLGIAIVGTRRADRKSVDIAGRLSADLVRAGCAVVSGGALGIDSAAHWGALHAGGATVAVLGCGLLADYLPENRSLRDKIAANGAVVSEYPGDTAPLGRNFPVRNRLIAGLSVGTVVIEAGEKSGSLITATCAAEQGRDVFAVPGDVFGSTYTGGNKLIREGAKSVFSAMDILEEYELLYPELLNMRGAERDLERPAMEPEQVAVKPPPAKPKPAPVQAPPSDLPAPEQKILSLLQGGALHIDGIMKAAGVPFGALCAALTNLEIQGLVAQGPGRMYEIRR